MRSVQPDSDNKKHIVDLCSGAAGPWPGLVEHLGDVEVLLTDRVPNLEAFARARASSGAVRGRSESLDALHVPKELRGCRTVVNGFHHFRPDQARQLIGNTVAAREPLVVCEMLSRSPLQLLTSPLIVLAVLFVTPMIRPRSLGRFLWTYVIPILPLLIGWDGLVSALRVYSESELRALVEQVPERESYEWEIEMLALGPLRVPYLVGIPREAVPEA